MRKLAVVLGFLLVVVTFTACTKDEATDNEQIEILSPNKDKSDCTACGH